MNSFRLRVVGGLLLLGIGLGPTASWAGEILVNQQADGFQRQPSIAMDPRGGFVVAWQHLQRRRIDGRRFDRDGTPLGGDFEVSGPQGRQQSRPAVASGGDSGFVVVWSDYRAAQDFRVSGQLFDAAGNLSGPKFAVNRDAPSFSWEPQAAVASQGPDAFVAVWTDWPVGLRGRRFGWSGQPLGEEFAVSCATCSGYQPALAVTSDGGFVVAWASQGIFARRFDPQGQPITEPFVVNTWTTATFQGYPAVATDAADKFVVAWISGGQESGGDAGGIFAQRFDASNTRIGDEFHVNTYTPGPQYWPAVAADAAGGFMVGWVGYPGFSGQSYDAAGSPVGEEFLIKPHVSERPAVKSDPAGPFVVAWSVGLDADIYALRHEIDPQDVTVREGDENESIDVTIERRLPLSVPLEASFTTVAGSASSADFVRRSGAVSLEPGMASTTVPIVIKGDLKDEGTETFSLALFAPEGAPLARPSATISILDRDPSPILSITDVSTPEGGQGQTRTVTFVVSLSESSGREVAVSFETEDGSAIAPGDYVGRSGTLLFAPGQTSKSVAIKVKGDGSAEGNEVFALALRGAVNATIADDTGAATIVDDDAALPVVAIADALPVVEGGSAEFLVTLTPAPTQPVTVTFATASGSATQGKDFKGRTGTLKFVAGQASRAIAVASKVDTLAEGTETFVVNLTAASGASLGDAQGQASILDVSPASSAGP